jgi:hypothetical protein
VLRDGKRLPCLGVAELAPGGAALLLGLPSRPGEQLRLALVNPLRNYGEVVVLRVTSCTPVPGGFLARGHLAPSLDPVACRLLLG